MLALGLNNGIQIPVTCARSFWVPSQRGGARDGTGTPARFSPTPPARPAAESVARSLGHPCTSAACCPPTPLGTVHRLSR